MNFGSGWQKLAGNSFGHAIALKTNGTLWGWGANWSGQIGQPQSRSTNVFYNPAQIGADNDWCDISVGAGHSIALKKDGSIWAMGQNTYGELGDGTLNDRFSPARIGTNQSWKAIACGDFNGYAINSNGTVWGWGTDFVKGGGGKNVLSPVQIDSATNWSRIWGSDYVLFGLKTDGTLWIRGQSASWAAVGYLNGPATNFVQLGNDSDWDDLVGGLYGFFAHKKDGTWWACGWNSESELGFHRFGRVARFERVPFSLDPWAFSVGGKTTLLLAKDGTLWTWGERIGAEDLGQELKKSANQLFSKLHMGWLSFNKQAVIDQAPHLLWKLPAEVRKSLETNSAEKKGN